MSSYRINLIYNIYFIYLFFLCEYFLCIIVAGGGSFGFDRKGFTQDFRWGVLGSMATQYLSNRCNIVNEINKASKVESLTERNQVSQLINKTLFDSPSCSTVGTLCHTKLNLRNLVCLVGWCLKQIGSFIFKSQAKAQHFDGNFFFLIFPL